MLKEDLPEFFTSELDCLKKFQLSASRPTYPSEPTKIAYGYGLFCTKDVAVSDSYLLGYSFLISI
jgi:hypothetical protein